VWFEIIRLIFVMTWRSLNLLKYKIYTYLPVKLCTIKYAILVLVKNWYKISKTLTIQNKFDNFFLQILENRLRFCSLIIVIVIVLAHLVAMAALLDVVMGIKLKTNIRAQWSFQLFFTCSTRTSGIPCAKFEIWTNLYIFCVFEPLQRTLTYIQQEPQELQLCLKRHMRPDSLLSQKKLGFFNFF
jgi:hypothetical protein